MTCASGSKLDSLVDPWVYLIAECYGILRFSRVMEDPSKALVHEHEACSFHAPAAEKLHRPAAQRPPLPSWRVGYTGHKHLR